MARPLVIVESPAKARTIAGYLGADVVVESSIGHVRDLPARAADLPAEHKGEPWARLAVNVYDGFRPVYVVHSDKKAKIADLRRLMKEASELYLATDEDREGEAIAWHLLEVLRPPAKVPVKRMVFHEITPTAIRAAMDQPRELDRRLVDAQEARRILDRLYGWEVGEVVWKKVRSGLSAGRVQSVATRLVVERERARMAFVAAGYWGLEGQFRKIGTPDTFPATLVELDGARVATGRDFDDRGQLQQKEGRPVVVLDRATAEGLVPALRDQLHTVTSVERKPYRRRPAPPFITSTLQQEAGRKLRLTAAQAMAAAQRLYENGYITYMRTDSTTLSETALVAARTEISERYGSAYLPDAPRTYSKKVKNAQEAHEAIRPAGDRFRSPDQVERELGRGAEARVYDLIWKRTIASQMTDALGETVTVRLGATTTDGRQATFATSGTIITHAGFRLAYVEGSDDPEAEVADQERQLPALAEGDGANVRELVPDGHETQPPARYTEASLVKRMEELGVGRPSTYASVIKTIQDRGYVWKRGSALVPTFTGFAVVQLLERHFPALVDYTFTARMEDDLDAIASGNEDLVPWLSRFYWGGDQPPGPDGGLGTGLKHMVSDLGAIDARDVSGVLIGADPDGVAIVARAGQYGAYVERGDDRASVPDDVVPDELTVDKALELLAAPREGRPLGTDPATGLTVYARAGRFGPYVQLGEVPDDAPKGYKPRTASLFSSMRLDTITLDEALQLLTLPRVVGTDPADGGEIVVQNGRHGPYLSKAVPPAEPGAEPTSETRSIDSEEQLFTITLDECLRLLAEPKRRRGQGRAAGPLREMGEDPNTGRPMVVRDGRFGPYVTDGETNASLRTGDAVETLTADRAAELLQDRRDRGPAKKAGRGAKKAGARKAGAKKAAVKKAGAKKAGVKKAAARPTAAKKVAAKRAAGGGLAP